MTDHAPAAQTAPLPALHSGGPDMDQIARAGAWLAFAESGEKTAQALGAAAALRHYYADALGLPPFAAGELSMIGGRLVVSAKLLRALAQRAGYDVRREDSTDEACTAVVWEVASGREVGRATFTMEDARRAGLIRDRSAWKTHPARMLWARASKYALDDYLPGVTLGLLTADEAAEAYGGPEPVHVREAYDPTVAEMDSTDEAEAEAEWAEADTTPNAAADEAKAAAMHDLAQLLARIDADGLAPPGGYSGWTDYARGVASEEFGVDGLAELNADEVQHVIGHVDAKAGLQS